MRLGIEFTSCQDAIGRKHYRVAPYFRGTGKQRTYSLAAIALTTGMIALMLLGMIYTDVPPTQPHVDLTPYYGAVR